MEDNSTPSPIDLVAVELHIEPLQVASTVALLAEGNTVPFIARYRKEATGGLDEKQIRAVEERHGYVVELNERRDAILASIAEQGKLTDELGARIRGAATKAALEDLYLPFKPKRRTRAAIARERGLEPLALRVLGQPSDGDPLAEAAAFINAEKGVDSAEAALAGARDIAAEAVSENAAVRALVRNAFAETGLLVSQAAGEQTAEASKFADYFDHREKVATLPSHRFLAMRRGEREGALKLKIAVDDEALLEGIGRIVGADARSPFFAELRAAVADGYKRLIAPSVENDVRVDLKLRSDKAAVDVFASNLTSLLLGAPFGGRPVVGVDPGLRTGCKCAAVDATGKYLGAMIFHLVHGDRALAAGKDELVAFARRHRPDALAVGNGTAGREAMAFVRETLRAAGLGEVIAVSVSEAGASVYSASELAAAEHPDLDVTVRGAISIARRLQDPLAELVKIEPKSIGVGQYQHDVHQPLLARKLDEVVESCVNRVGVDLNTASAPLLSRVAGISKKVAAGIVALREAHGPFADRAGLREVPGLGPKAFEQSAGFLRIRGGGQPLDASAVHPERYGLVGRMAADLGVSVAELIGEASIADRIEIARYTGGDVGEPTLRDIVAELKKPGRDPRSAFDPPAFRDDVQTLEDLAEGMLLEGIVTNVTAFGAFVDVGVHQDGLVHVSELFDRFVEDPREVVAVGDKISVRVLGVDLPRRRISLSAKKEPRSAAAKGVAKSADKPPPRRDAPPKFSNTPFADLLKK